MLNYEIALIAHYTVVPFLLSYWRRFEARISAMHTSMKIVIVAVILVTTLFISNHYTSLTLHLDTEQLPEPTMGTVHIKHSMFIHSAPFSKYLIVHSVHFDNRARNGHDNVTVFLVGANKTIFDSKWIVGCAAGSKVASNFTAHLTITGINVNNWLGPQHFPYKEIIVECYDLPVMEGSPAYVMYKTAADSPVHSAESEHPVYFPAPRVKPTGEHNFTVVTCVKVNDKGATWLPEFVRYQRTIGVDHVHIMMLDTFIKDGGLDKAHLADSYLAQATSEGFVSYNMWIDWYLKNEVFVHSENLRKLDCLYRFRGTYDYAFSLDTDDFFTPRIPGQTNVKDYILKWCYGNSIGSCTFNWIYYFPDKCGVIDNKRPDDGNVTKKLRSFANSSRAKHYKSVHLMSALVDASAHEALCKWCLMPGYRVVNVPPHIAYMAHLRMKAEQHIKC